MVRLGAGYKSILLADGSVWIRNTASIRWGNMRKWKTDRDALSAMYEVMNMGCTEIGRIFSVSKGAVNHMRREYGIPTKLTPRPRWSNEFRKATCDLYHLKKSLKHLIREAEDKWAAQKRHV